MLPLGQYTLVEFCKHEFIPNPPNLDKFLFKIFIYDYPTQFLILSFPVYHILYIVCEISLDISPTHLVHLVSWRHIMFMLFLIIVSTISVSFLIKEPIFQVPVWILFSWTSFFTTPVHQSVGTLAHFSLLRRADVVCHLKGTP